MSLMLLPGFIGGGSPAAGGAGAISSISSIDSGAGRRLGGSGLNASAVGIPSFEFIGDPTGHLETTSTGNDSSFGSWSLPVGTPDAQKSIVDDGDRGNVWFCNPVSGGDYFATMRYDWGSTIAEATRVYVSWWTKRSITSGSGQWKKFRLSNTNNVNDHAGEMRYHNWSGSGDSNLIINPSGGSSVQLYNTLSDHEDSWVREDILLTTNTVGSKDGNCQFYQHDQSSSPSLVDWSYSSEPSPKYPAVNNYEDAQRYRWFIFYNYIGNGLTDIDVYTDDIYLQVGSFSRVEIGNSATYASCTKREVQRVTTRNSTTVDFTVNLGGQSSFSGWTVFFLDDDGSVLGSIPFA